TGGWRTATVRIFNSGLRRRMRSRVPRWTPFPGGIGCESGWRSYSRSARLPRRRCGRGGCSTCAARERRTSRSCTGELAPRAGSVEPGDENYFRKLYFHPLGGDWETDPLIYARPKKEEMLGVSLSPDGRWLCVTVQEGWARNEVWLQDRRQAGGELGPVVQGE